VISAEGQGQGQGQSGAQALTLGPSQDLNKVRRKEAAAAVAHEKGGLEKGGYHWGVRVGFEKQIQAFVSGHAFLLKIDVNDFE